MSNILSALQYLDVTSMTYQEWVNIGMALKSEGFSWQEWDSWSRGDPRYHPGECERKWNSFRGSAVPLTGATIIQMAKERGWTAWSGNVGLAWDDCIEDDTDHFGQPVSPGGWNPSEDLITYLDLLYERDDIVGYVTNDVWQDQEGRWVPAKGVFNRTAGELIEALHKHPNDVGAAVGDWKADVGAWIRFNPLDGNGVRNENVTQFKFALVESDTMPVAEQEAMYRQLELPIACMVHSGGKSLHAIVRIEAKDYDEYQKRVDFLYAFLEKNGLCVDKQNRNPSRLSRMPGVTRNGNRQYLVATNIGRKSWQDWVDYTEGVSDELPDMVTLDTYKGNLPKLPEELIKGVLRCGHKMLISGSSKAGKSFALMELSIAIAEGTHWLGFPCKQGRVLYVNLEIDPASCITRFMKIYEALKLPQKNMGNIVIWNLRGHAVPLDKLVPKLVRRMRDQKLDAVIVDPIYKVITGDENNASDMAAFCNQFDKICTETGCAVIYCHHHSKGAQGAKRAMDRASGSGVFARDPDAQLDMIQLELTEDQMNNLRDGNATAWRLECSLREFENFVPVNFWFEYPIHRLDTSGELGQAYAEGSPMANLSKSKKYTNSEDRRASIDSAYQACSCNPMVTVADMAEYLNLTPRCVRDRLNEMKEQYSVHKGIVVRITENE